jgi:hypothetical protein
MAVDLHNGHFALSASRLLPPLSLLAAVATEFNAESVVFCDQDEDETVAAATVATAEIWTGGYFKCQRFLTSDVELTITLLVVSSKATLDFLSSPAALTSNLVWFLPVSPSIDETILTSLPLRLDSNLITWSADGFLTEWFKVGRII